MEYLGGTYISQVQAEGKEQAMQIWIYNLEVGEVEGLTERDKKNAIVKGFEEDDPCALKGILHTWHFMVRAKRGIAFVNFVQTVR